ncbi:MAG: RluA family pseudouridine synthase [Spirochaetia bacterium]|jgi:23S rRNA pseudouridine955/2504/2580 synthase|nr:RluA family pseudouridine synthase [Spirochaetia bacterium]
MESSFRRIACAGADDQDKRIDRILRIILPSLPLGIIYREIRKGRIRINSKKTDPGRHISKGDSIEIHRSLLPLLKMDIDNLNMPDVILSSVKKEDLFSLDIIFENSMILAVNKPAGIAVHQGSRRSNKGIAGKKETTLDEIVKSRYSEITGRSLSFSPSPLHRLDKNTSGIILFGKSIEGARIITELLREKKIKKKYIALLDRCLDAPAEWTDYLSHDTDRGIAISKTFETGGRKAVTRAVPLLHSKQQTLAAVDMETGRYHQIRKQCAIHGHPLSWDRKYGSSGKAAESYILHCFSLKLELTEKDKNPGFTLLTSPLPESALKKLSKIFGQDEIENIFKNLSF